MALSTNGHELKQTSSASSIFHDGHERFRYNSNIQCWS